VKRFSELAANETRLVVLEASIFLSRSVFPGILLTALEKRHAVSGAHRN
jgi:hypothetical protein